MPRVPISDNFQVAPNALPQPRLTVADASQGVGDQSIQLGQAMQGAGNQLHRVALDMQQQLNQVRVDEGINELTRTRTDMLTQVQQLQGKNALDRPDNKSLADEYSDKFQEQVASVAGRLGNDAQRMALLSQSRPLQQQLYASTSLHMVEQNKVYTKATAQAKLETAVDQAARLADNEDAFVGALGDIRRDVFAQTLQSGGDEDMARAAYQDIADKTYLTRYKAFQQKDAAAALANFQTHADSISPVMRDQINDELFSAASPQLVKMIQPWMLSEGDAPYAAGSNGSSTGAKIPRGIRNNNPGNIVRSDNAFQGEMRGSDSRFASFSTPEAGIRAMGRVLITYQDKRGLDTAEQIISRWAPASENGASTAAYVTAVSKAAGVEPNMRINLKDGSTLGRVVRAMIGFENGQQPYSEAQINAGLSAALGTSALPKDIDPAKGTNAPATTAVTGFSGLQQWQDPNAKTGIAVIDRLSPDQRIRLHQAAQTQIKQDMGERRESLRQRMQDASAEYMASGSSSQAPSEDEFIRVYGQVDGPKAYQQLRDVAVLGGQVQQLKALPKAAIEQLVQSAKPAQGEGYFQRQQNYAILQKAAQEVTKQRQADPVLFAQQTGAYGIAALPDPANAQALGKELSKRGAAMRQLAIDYGTPPALMSDDEAKRFSSHLSGLQAADKARVLGQVASAAGSAGVGALSVQLKDKDRQLAVAAALAANTTTKGRNASELYLQGLEAIEQKRVTIDTATETGIKAQIFRTIDGVYQTPQGRDAAAEAVYGIYAKLKAEGNSDLKQAISIATGGVMDFNGRKIAKPYGWDDSRFKDALSGPIKDTVAKTGGSYQIGGQKVEAAQLADSLAGARLQTLGNGSYLILAGSDMVRTSNGAPYILKVGAADVR